MSLYYTAKRHANFKDSNKIQQDSRNYPQATSRQFQFNLTRVKFNEARSDEKTCFPGHFAVSHSESNRPVQPVLYSLFIETTAKHDTPPQQSPHRLYDSPLCEGPLARKSVYCWRYVAFSSKDRSSRKKKRKKKRQSFIMELRNCKLSKYNGRPLARRPELAFCLRHRAPAARSEYRVTSNQSI